ncbi:MAG: Ig-like domain-containing protein [Bacteroidota bacterium]
MSKILIIFLFFSFALFQQVTGNRLTFAIDKSYYVSSEAVHFVAVLNTDVTEPASIRVLLVNTQNEVEKQIDIAYMGGHQVHGSFVLPEDVVSGYFKLVGYIINRIPNDQMVDAIDFPVYDISLLNDGTIEWVDVKKNRFPQDEAKYVLKKNQNVSLTIDLDSLFESEHSKSHFTIRVFDPYYFKNTFDVPTVSSFPTEIITLISQSSDNNRRGVVIDGNGNPLSGIPLSISPSNGNAAFLQFITTNDSGEFLVPEYVLQKQTSFLIHVFNDSITEDVEIKWLTEPQPTVKFKILKRPMTYSRVVLRYLEDEVKRRKYQSYFTLKNVKGKETITPDFDDNAAPFYAPASKTVYPGEYTDFRDMAETIKEIVPSARYRKTGEIENIRVIKWYYNELAKKKTTKFSEIPPLLLVNGLPVTTDYFLSLTPARLERVDVVTKEGQVRGILFGGIVSVVTDNSQEMIDDLLLAGSAIMGDESLNVKQVEYNIQTNASGPDFRTTLLWDPAPKINVQNEIHLTFKTSDLTGTYVLEIRQIKDTGESKKHSFMVKVTD